jgi:hypothetical protein
MFLELHFQTFIQATRKFMEHTNSANLCVSMFVTGMMCDKIEMKTCSNCSLKFSRKLSGKKKH